jgi:hypothetical protein
MSRNNPDSWRAASARRRDFRAAHDAPEVPRPPRSSHRATPRTPSRTSSVRCPSSPSNVHDPERYAVEVKRYVYEREDGINEQVRTEWAYHCRYCGATNIAPRLLGPVCETLDATTRMRLLAHFWCGEGHLYETTPVEVLGIRYVDRWARRRGPKVICVMCGHSKRPQWSAEPPDDLDLYQAAGVPSDVLERMASAAKTYLRYSSVTWEYHLTPRSAVE